MPILARTVMEKSVLYLADLQALFKITEWYVKKYKSHYYPTCSKYICSNYVYLFHFL
jgi:hypothetical protein